jgi:hypothetical protein
MATPKPKALDLLRHVSSAAHALASKASCALNAGSFDEWDNAQSDLERIRSDARDLEALTERALSALDAGVE